MWPMRSWLERFRDLLRAAMSTPELLARVGAAQGPASGIRIVALVADQGDRELLSRLAAEHQWVLHFAGSSGEAWDALNQSKAPIVLCDRELPAAEWRDVIHMMVSSAHQVYAILVSKVADDYLWNEVIRRGGHDLLTTPLREEDVLRAIRLAWSYWNSSMKVQPLLMKHSR
jgi:FixJ family two-component response regulator